MCLSHLIYTVRPCLIHTFHVIPMPCSDHAVLFKATAQHGRLLTAVLCCGLEKNGMVGAWHGYDMESLNQTRTHCVNQMGKTHSKPLAARHGTARHGRGTPCYVWIGLYCAVATLATAVHQKRSRRDSKVCCTVNMFGSSYNCPRWGASALDDRPKSASNISRYTYFKWHWQNSISCV